jgi:hypothetical protein
MCNRPVTTRQFGAAQFAPEPILCARAHALLPTDSIARSHCHRLVNPFQGWGFFRLHRTIDIPSALHLSHPDLHLQIVLIFKIESQI